MTATGPGQSYPLGVTWDGAGVNVAVYSEGADYIEFCVFDDDGGETRTVLGESTGFIHHGYFAGVEPGTRYGFRAQVTASIRASCSSTRMPERSRGSSPGTMPCSATNGMIRPHRTVRTVPRSCPGPW